MGGCGWHWLVPTGWLRVALAGSGWLDSGGALEGIALAGSGWLGLWLCGGGGHDDFPNPASKPTNHSGSCSGSGVLWLTLALTLAASDSGWLWLPRAGSGWR